MYHPVDHWTQQNVTGAAPKSCGKVASEALVVVLVAILYDATTTPANVSPNYEAVRIAVYVHCQMSGDAWRQTPLHIICNA